MGKRLQRENVLRGNGSATAGGHEPLTIESVGWQARAALPPLRLHSVSIYDTQGNVLWLSEGALGPDEHALVLEVLERLNADPSLPGSQESLEDGRTAVCLAVRAPQGQLVGLLMILADGKGGEGLRERVLTVPLRTVMHKLAVLLRPAGPRPPDADPTGLVLSLAEDDPSAAAGKAPAAAPEPAPSASPGAPEELTPGAVDHMLAREPAPAARARPLAAGAIGLDVLPFVRLRPGGRLRRLEVLPRASAREMRDPAALDMAATESLLRWLGAHRAAWSNVPTTFTLNLSIATLEDERFPRRLAEALVANGISAETLGFEIAEPLCAQRRAAVERFLAHCERIGCFAVIDDFSFDSAVTPLLRSKAVRLVKIESRLAAAAVREKLSQAIVVAIAQAVKVLGMHCAAQQVDSQATLKWLTAVGFDFAQGPMLAGAHPLEQLEGAPASP